MEQQKKRNYFGNYWVSLNIKKKTGVLSKESQERTFQKCITKPTHYRKPLITPKYC